MRYISRPVEVEAARFNTHQDVWDFLDAGELMLLASANVTLTTGLMIWRGDWMVRHVNGDIEALTDEDFTATYLPDDGRHVDFTAHELQDGAEWVIECETCGPVGTSTSGEDAELAQAARAHVEEMGR